MDPEKGFEYDTRIRRRDEILNLKLYLKDSAGYNDIEIKQHVYKNMPICHRYKRYRYLELQVVR